MAEPPGSAAALADQTGSTYQREDAAKGLSARPPVVELVLEDELLDEDEELELEELELLLDDELLELEELELLEDEELLLELLDELVVPLLDELLDDELELEVPELPPLIAPVEAVSVTRSSLAPSSRLLI